MRIYENNRKQLLINYITDYNNIKYNKDYISRIIYNYYININPKLSEDDTIYDNIIVSILSSHNFYTLLYHEDIIKNIISYYDKEDIQFANYLRSVNCLLWIINKYFDIYIEDKTFNNIDLYSMELYMTPEIQKFYDENTDPSQNKKSRLRELASIIEESGDFPDYYDQICHTSDWAFVELAKIIYYMDTHDIELYPTLQRFAEDYEWSMYKSNKSQGPGFSSISRLVLGDLKYEYGTQKDRTPELQSIFDEINKKTVRHFIKDYKDSLDTLLRVFRRTIEKQLTWGLQIIG